jgi:hypothetical protein
MTSWIVIEDKDGKPVAIEDPANGMFKKLMKNPKIKVICTYYGKSNKPDDAIAWGEELYDNKRRA